MKRLSHFVRGHELGVVALAGVQGMVDAALEEWFRAEPSDVEEFIRALSDLVWRGLSTLDASVLVAPTSAVG